MLWEQSLVMVDKETRSYWSQLLGRAMKGPMKGESLEVIPSVVTDWATWRERYPQTTVAVFDRSYTSFHRSSHRQHEHLLIGLVDGSKSRYWFFESLREHPVINDEIGEQAILVCYDLPAGTAGIFSRKLGAETATFVERGEDLIDRATGTVWDRVTGQAISGSLRGRQLARLNGVVSLDLAWATFHPDSQPGKHGLPSRAR